MRILLNNANVSMTENGPTKTVQTSGFTLVEIIIATAVMIMLVGIGLWASMDVYRGYSYRSERDMLVSALQKARIEAMVNLNESEHGLRVEANKYVVFQGSSYGESPVFDREIIPPRAISISGAPPLPRDIVFKQLSGSTDSEGTLTITDGARSAIISINGEGGISW